MANGLLELVLSQWGSRIISSHADFGDNTIVVDKSDWHEVHVWLHRDERTDMQMLVDLTAVDYPSSVPRFVVTTHLHSLRLGHRLRVKAQVGDARGADAQIASLCSLWGSANWAERECYDMFGIDFVGHPDLRRILLYPEFAGHPLRKDYDVSFAQPIVLPREAPKTDKVPPFDASHGMPLSRRRVLLPTTAPAGVSTREE